MKSIRVALAALLALLCAAPAFAQDIYHVGRDTGAAVNTNQTVLVDPSTGTRVGSTANPLPVTSTSAAAGTPGSAAPAGATQVGGTDGTNLRVLKTDTSGNQIVVGNVASGSADSGAPVKAGGVYNSTLPTAVSGSRYDLQLGSKGQLVTVGATAAGGLQTGNNPSDAVGNNGTTAMDVRGFGTLFNGTTWDRQRSIPGIDGTGLGVTAVEQGGAAFSNITTATTTTVKSGAGTFHKLCLNTFVASGTITIYNNTTATGTKIGTITTPATLVAEGPQCAVYDVYFSTGLTIVTTGTQDITVIYR